MKRYLLLLFLVFSISVLLNGHENPDRLNQNRFGLTFSSFGTDDVIVFERMMGAASYNSDKFYTVGFNYLSPLGKRWDFETGIEYSTIRLMVNPNLPPDWDRLPYRVSFSLINIPVTLRLNFLKYFFLNGGLIFDFDASASMPIDSQTGIGSVMGLGCGYDFKSGISVFINPYSRMHALVPFSSQANHQRILESGVRFGVMYRLR